MASAALVILTLSIALYEINGQRAIAQRRFQQVRQLSNKVLGLDQAMRELPGSTKVRQEIVAISKGYLEGLESDAESDAELQLELGSAYLALAQAEGVPNVPNLGMYDQAKQSLIKANAMLEGVRNSSEHKRTALVRLAEVNEAFMMLADANPQDDQALRHAREAAASLEGFLGLGEPTAINVE